MVRHRCRFSSFSDTLQWLDFDLGQHCSVHKTLSLLPLLRKVLNSTSELVLIDERE